MKRIMIVSILFLIVPVTAPAVKDVFVLQDACVRCHLLLEDGLGGDSVLKWKGGVHFRMDSTCTDCHGGSKYLSISFKRGHMGLPNAADTVEMCGKCHPEAKSDFVGSRSQLKNNPPSSPPCKVSCINCHGYHLVQTADGSLINNNTCGSCHSPDRAAPLMKAIAKAESSFKSIEKKIGRYDRQDFPTQSFKITLDNIRWDFTRSFHSQTAGKIQESITSSTMKSLSDLDKEIKRRSPRKWKTEGVIVVMFLFTVTALIWIYQRTIH